MRAPKLLLAALLVAAPITALADPGTLLFLATQALATAGVITATQAVIINVAIAVIGGINARRKARKAAARARAQYNASLTDRNVTALSGEAPWQIVYGRANVGGALVAILTSNNTNAERSNGSTYTQVDGLKHLVVVLAAHECEAIHDVMIDGVSVGTIGSDGWATSGPFVDTKGDTRTKTFTTASTTLPRPATAILRCYEPATSGDSGENDVPYTLSGGGLTVTRNDGVSGRTTIVDYTTDVVHSRIRVEKHLGSPSQTASTYLMAQCPSEWTSNHRLRGRAYVVVTLDLNEERFQGGPPNMTFEVSGRKLYDTRTGTTAWSSNPALIVRDWLLAEWGYSVDASEIDNATVNVAANACDEDITLQNATGGPTTSARYTANGAFTTDDSREAVLADLVESMAGYAVHGAQWGVYAGTWTPPVMDLTDADLDGSIEIVQAGVAIEELFNSVRGKFIQAGEASVRDFPPYSNSTFVAADGERLWTDIDLPWTDHPNRATNLARVAVERNRSGQVIRYPAKLRAWPLTVGDRVRVSSAEYGFSLKTYRVTDWDFSLTSVVMLTLQEDAEEIYDQEDATVPDPTPNTNLPDPWEVATVSTLAATSGAAYLLLLADGTVVPRVYVQWALSSSAYVVGGTVTIQWRGRNTDAWNTVSETSDKTSVLLADVREGDVVIIRACHVNTQKKAGDWKTITHVVSGSSTSPGNVTGLAATVGGSNVQFTWDAAGVSQYKETELRLGTWSSYSASLIVSGTSVAWTAPAPGTYSWVAKHRTWSGVESTAVASVTVSATAGGGISPNISRFNGTAAIATDDSFAGVRFNTNGTIDVHVAAGGWVASGFWYSPATTGIGSSYWIRATLRSGDAPTSSAALGTWLPLSSARLWELSETNNAGGIKECVLDVFIASDSAGATLVSSGTLSLFTEVSV